MNTIQPRTGPRPTVLLTLAMTLLCLAVGGSRSAQAADKYPNTPDGAKALLSEFLKPGADLKTLYLTAGDKVYKRTLRRTGVFPWQPVKLPRPQL